MIDQIKNVMIGLFVTAAAFVIIFILMFLHPRIGNEGKILHVRFTDIDKVTVGTRVTYGGKPVGEVVNIEEIDTGRHGKKSPNGRIYTYDLTLQVDSGVNVFNSDNVSLRTSGLLGEKNIEITPMAPMPGEALIKIDDEPIYSIETGTVEDTFKEFKEAADKFEVALDAATDVLNRIRDQNLVEKITKTVEHVQSIAASLDKPKEWEETLDNVHNLSERVNTTWDTIDSIAQDFKHTSENFSVASDHGKEIIVNVSNGQGTVGRLLASDEIYLRTNSIMSKLETIMDDINHYGILFQSDKGWQRLRARRLNLLQQLRTPQEFLNYFNDEVDQISTSLSRVAMVLDSLNCDPYCCNVVNNCEFNKVFADLMRRVKMIEEEVRMYNTQLVEVQVHETELGCPPLCQQPCYNNQ